MKVAWPDGSVYIGNLWKGMRHGQGTYIFTDKKCYRGNWNEDKRCGAGFLYNKQGFIISSGIWRDDECIDDVSSKIVPRSERRRQSYLRQRSRQKENVNARIGIRTRETDIAAAAAFSKLDRKIQTD